MNKMKMTLTEKQIQEKIIKERDRLEGIWKHNGIIESKIREYETKLKEDNR